MKLHRIQAVFFRYFHDFYKGYHFLSDLFYWPFVDILLWGLTSFWISKETVSSIPLILMTGLVFWQMVRRSSHDISLSLVVEFWNRNLVHLFSSPLKVYEWACGVILVSLCKLSISISFGAFLVYLLYSLNVFSIGWAFIPFAINLCIFGWVIGFIASSAIIYGGHQMEGVSWMIPFVFAPFSAVFYPVDTLPEWARVISWSLPTTYIFEGMRLIIQEGHFAPSYFWISFLLDLLYLFGAIRLFSWMFEKSRVKGLQRLM